MKKKHVYAIIRLDNDCPYDKDEFTITKVVHNIERAQQKVQRLNQLNHEKGCEYYWQLTRLEEQET